MIFRTIFSKKDIKQKIAGSTVIDIPDKKQKIKLIENWQNNIVSRKIFKTKEEELQAHFLHTFFGNILGYNYSSPTKWNLSIETKTIFDNTKADGALGYFKLTEEKEIVRDIRAIIELKNANTPLDKPQNRKDFKGSPVEQAFTYAHKSGEKCKWIIVSNFLEIRLYQANDINKYERFNILALTDEEEFKRFYYLLSYGQLFLQNQLSVIESTLEARLEIEEKITNEFYGLYKYLREVFVSHLILHNPEKEPVQLLDYAQTIIDRMMFISVVKDYNLVNFRILQNIERYLQTSFRTDENGFWQELKYLFSAMNEGFPNRLQKFNGGLFKENKELNELIIKDEFLLELIKLSKYDFESDLNINILGHIFEQSLTDIEELRERIIKNPNSLDDIANKKHDEGERKTFGVFYTPEYITRFIVEQTVGNYLDEQKEKIGINKLQEIPGNKKDRNEHIELWKIYIKILQNIKILDPSCGSGAFLTQSFDFLVKEWGVVIDIFQKLSGEIESVKINGSLNIDTQELPEILKINKIKKYIVTNNLYGVDLNSVSVEITKLGLWIKTAIKNDSLAILEDNIKTGNSLINDPEIAGKKAFDWQKEFSEIMKNGGFDIIVGNPPWGAEINKEQRLFLHEKYDLNKNLDSAEYFIHQISKLLKSEGYFNFIVPKSIIFYKKWETSRNLILSKKVKYIADVGLAFDSVNLESFIFSFKNEKTNNNNNIDIYKFSPIKRIVPVKEYIKLSTIPQIVMQKNSIFITTEINIEILNIINKIQDKNSFIEDFDREVFRGLYIEDSIKKEILDTGDIRFVNKVPDVSRYEIKKIRNICIKKYLEKYNTKIKQLGKNRIIIKVFRGKYLTCTYVDKNIITTEKLVNLIIKDEKINIFYLLAILNSKLISFYMQKAIFSDTTETSRVMDDYFVQKIPLLKIDEKEQDKFIVNAKLLLSKKEELNEFKNNFIEILKSRLQTEKITKKLNFWYKLNWNEFDDELQKQKVKIKLKNIVEWKFFFEDEQKNAKKIFKLIEKTEKQINQMVYKLYDLTEKEIEIVEKH